MLRSHETTCSLDLLILDFLVPILVVLLAQTFPPILLSELETMGNRSLVETGFRVFPANFNQTEKISSGSSTPTWLSTYNSPIRSLFAYQFET